MTYIINIFKYDYVFRIYLFFIFIFNILTTYTFIMYRFFYKEKNYFFNNISDYFGEIKINTHFNNNNYDNVNFLFYCELKKIYNTLNNLVKIEYQINQSYQVKNNPKYKYFKHNIINIKNNKKNYLIYKKILKKIKKYNPNKNNLDKILLHLLCINF